MRMVRLLLPLLLLTAGCSGSNEDEPTITKPEVVVGAYPFAWLVAQVAPEAVEVVDLVKPGVEPHDVELTPRQVARVRSADVVFYLKGFQPALDDAIDGRDNAIDLGKALHQLRGEGDRLDPHVWLDPVLMKTMANEVAQALRERVPGLQADASSGTARLDALDRSLRAELTGCRTREFVTSHAAFAYFAERYSLVQQGITGLDPESEPSPGRLADVVRFAREHHVTTIFFEKLVSPRVARTVASEVGAKTAVLDPVESVEGSDDYLSVMHRNGAALHAALGCR
jgi:zinc transport system substrate-binding protein